MITKEVEKKKAIALRKEGKTYSEILRVVPVAKSTLSEWLRDVGLAKAQKQRITEKKLLSAKRGGEAKRRQRIKKQSDIFSQAKSEIKSISKKELFLIGVALYWAEGGKEKEYKTGSPIRFANSDPRMIQLFLTWLEEAVGVRRKDIYLDLYVHENHKYRLKDIITHWSNATSFPMSSFTRVYYKRNIINTKRRNIGVETYFGLVRVTVRNSSELVRKISGWVDGIVEKVG